jgi:COP9 signalosome complex subunit 5
MLMMQAGRLENAVGWYHSHPGYGCWLSGIDVSTQMLNQQYQEPFLAVVIDPTRTVSAGKVEIGAFRTYPEGYKPPDEPVSEYQTIPLNKIEDFGVHCKQVIISSSSAPWESLLSSIILTPFVCVFAVLCFGYHLF